MAYRALLAAGGVKSGTWIKKVEVARHFYLVGQKASMPDYFVCFRENSDHAKNLLQKLKTFSENQFKD